MAKPIAVQKLKHGKALCGRTFGGFVDTFNWLVDFCLSLEGDKDANTANGRISLDRSDESAPVIRYVKSSDNSDDLDSFSSGCWRLDIGENATYLRDNYYNAGGKTGMVGDIDVTSHMTSGFLAAIFEGPGNCSVNLYQSLSALQFAQDDKDTYVLPLYLLANGKVVLDMRNIPHLQVFEGSL